MITKEDLKIATIASKDSTRPVICAVQVKKTEGGLRLVATDGYRLTEKTIELHDTITSTDGAEIELEAPDFEELLIPAKTLLDVAKLMKTHDRLAISSKEFTILNLKTLERRTVGLGQLIDGNYPEYAALVPEKKTNYITLNARYIADLMAVADADGGAVQIQLAISETGTIERLAPVRIDSENQGHQTISVLMPLKS